MTHTEIRDHIRDCCDKCCEGYPKFTVDGQVEIYCSNCGLSAEGEDVYDAVQNWNKQVRKQV